MKQFKKIYIEITNICNLSCSFCPENKRKLEYMNIDLFEKILVQIKPFTDYIYLHVKGEPLLHPHLSSFLDLAHTKGFKVNITTNGTLINKVNNQLIDKPSLRQVNFSLHSLTGNVFKNNDEYLIHILDFSKTASSKGIYISLRLWNLQNNNLPYETNNSVINSIERELNLPFKIKDNLIGNNSLKLTKNIYLNLDYEFQWPSLNSIDLGEKGFCYGLRTHVGILVDGIVVPCCLDGEGIINLGNIKDSSFEDIIKNGRATKIFNGFSNRKAVEDLCKKCGYRTKMSI